jgi:UMF1 family MFS transporter
MEEDQFMDPDPALPRYPGEDTRPTSRREILGWYAYGWAAEVFTVCAMGKVPATP